MTANEIKALAKEIHEGNKKRGFWDNERPMSELLVLIRTEIDEAVEADREGRLCSLGINEDSEHSRIDTYRHLNIDAEFSTTLFKGYIKDTVEDELADTVYRILDTVASGIIDEDYFYQALYGLNYPNLLEYSDNDWSVFTDMVDEFHDNMPSRKGSKKFISSQLADCFCIVLYYCQSNNIDIWWHVKEKLKYNATRPYKHGKKY